MNKHASRGCIDESSTTGNMGEDFTIDVLIVRATITEMIQVFMMRPFPSLEISFQIYKKYNNKNKIKIKIYFQHFNHHEMSSNCIFPSFFLIFDVFRMFCLHRIYTFHIFVIQEKDWYMPHGLFPNFLYSFSIYCKCIFLNSINFVSTKKKK